jgi:hypothetical protein
MVRDDIIEASNSHILSPLTIVPREGKSPRVCVDARKVNQHTIPIHEILQRFKGVQYISSLDLSSGYLQIVLDEDSRKYTAFKFGTTVYQYKGIPYGFKNSSSAFITALKLTPGRETEDFVVYYVDDILIYSKSYEEHKTHIDTVIHNSPKTALL